VKRFINLNTPVNYLDLVGYNEDLCEEMIHNYNITSIPDLIPLFPCLTYYFERNKQLMEIRKSFQWKSTFKVNDMKFRFQ
jgi:hypothetical protein